MKPWEQYQSQQPAAKPWDKFAAKPETTQKEVGIGRTAFDQALQGGTFGFADEISDFLGAGYATANSKITGNGDPSFSSNYDQARQLSKDQLSAEFEQNPGTAIASNLAGGLLTGGAGATTKAGQAVGNFARSGNIAARMVKNAGLGAASGAAYGLGSANNGERIEGAERGGVLGGVVGAAAPVVGAALNKLNTKTIIPNSEEIRVKGSELFKLADEAGGALRPEIADQFYDKVLQIKPQTLEGSVFKGESPVSKIMDAVPSLKGKPLTLQGAKEIDEALGDLAYGTMDKFGKLTSDGKKFLDMQTSLRRTIENANENQIIGGKGGFEAIKEARKYWSTSLRLRDIEKIIDNAQYMDNPATAIRTGFRTLLRNPDRLKGYTPAEVKAIEKAAKTGVVTDLFRLAGSGLLPIGATVTGFGTGGPAGAAAAGAAGYAVQQGAKKVAETRQLGRATDAAAAIAERSGMVQQVPRLDIRQIMRLPPKEAEALLKRGK